MGYVPLDFSVDKKFEQFLQESLIKQASTPQADYSWSKLTHNRVFGVYDMTDPASRRKYYDDITEAERGTKLFYQTIQLNQYLEKYPYMSQFIGRRFVNYKPDDEEEPPAEIQASTFSAEISDVWTRLGVSRDVLEVWKERLRKYLVRTILVRLDEIARIVGEELSSSDISWNRINFSNLDNLQLDNVTDLLKLAPFLDFTMNRDYVIQRLGKLSSGGYMSAFKWKSGGEYRGAEWSENLPTDCALIMNFFCTYMDHILPVNPLFISDRPFSNCYFIGECHKPYLSELKEGLYLVELSTSPPRYDVLFQGELANLSDGPSNIFQAVLLFFFVLKTRYGGMLRRLNLGRSGLNLLWIFDD